MTNQKIAVDIVELAYNEPIGTKKVEYSIEPYLISIKIHFGHFIVDIIEYGISDDSIEAWNEDDTSYKTHIEVLNITKVIELFKEMK